MSAGVAVVLPVKATIGAKQRLSSRLAPTQRRMLALAMAGDVLRVVSRAVDVRRCVVVAGDAEVERLAARVGMAAIRERGAGQSAALRVGVAWAAERGHTAVATLAADCPLATADDVAGLVEVAARRGRFLRCVADAEGTGTNAVALRPLTLDVWRFGPGSLAAHGQAARDHGLTFGVLDLPSLRIDCDRPEDLAAVLDRPRPTATFHMLRELGIVQRAAG